MITTKSHLLSIMVMYAIALHLCWAALIVIDPVAVQATALHALYHYVRSPQILAELLVLAAAMAMIGLFTRTPWIVLMLIPQQILLMGSAAGAVEAVYLSQFADGVVRAQAFVAADQIYSVLAAIGHTVALFAHARRIVG